MARSPSGLAKLSRPRLFDAVPRERLFARLDEMRCHPLIWISGPPGAGKTALVGSWLASRNLPCRWYHVDAGDVDPATLFFYLVELGHGRRGKPLPYLTADYLLDLPAFCRRFFREFFARMPAESVLVFDNCQEAPSSPFYKILTLAASELRHGMTIAALSRQQPPAELSKLQANRDLAVLAWEELRLTRDETLAIAQRSQVTRMADVDDLFRRSDGWAAGLVLLLANLKQGARPADSHAETEEALFAYFAGEIFDRLPSSERDLLMRTALLPEVTPDLAAALCGNAAAPALLERLYRKQYFTDRRTQPRLSYRYHDLFRDFLLARAEEEFSGDELNRVRCSAADLLLEAAQHEPAVRLYEEARRWDRIEAVIIGQADALMGQGRWQTLLRWHDMLPREHAERNPWLLYWRGVAEEINDVPRSRLALEKAIHGFAARGNRAGEALALSTLVEGYFQEWNTVDTMDPWLDALLHLLDEQPQHIPQAYVSRAQTSLLIGLLHRRPGDPALRTCLSAINAHIAEESNPSERMRMTLFLILYHDLMGDWERVDELLRRAAELRAMPSVAPRLRIWEVFRSCHHHTFLGNPGKAIEESELVLRLAKDEGVMISPAFQLLGHAMALLGIGRVAEGYARLQEARPLLQPGRYMEVVFFHWLEVWAVVLQGDHPRAQALWDAFAKMPAVGVAFHTAYNLPAIFLLAERGDCNEALQRVSRWREMLRGMGSPFLNYNLDLMEAYARLATGDETLAIAALSAAFGAAARCGFYGNLGWVPEMMSRLCAKALEARIESDFVSRLIRRKSLKPPRDAQHWPWPVKIYALGRFLVLKDEQPIRFARRPQHRPLELLQAIIAGAGTGARISELVAGLWTDSEGDAAHTAFGVALHRLRKLLGSDDSLLVREGRVYLNPVICWVDALAFDAQATSALAYPELNEQGLQAVERLVRLYSGHFLGNDVDSPWAVRFRDRLRAKFRRLVLTLGTALESDLAWARAAMVYQRALEVDNLQEDIYRRLMVCLREQGERAGAVNVYRRCRDLLSIVLGVGPSAETEAVARSLQR